MSQNSDKKEKSNEVLANDIGYIKDALKRMELFLTSLVTKAEFDNHKQYVYKDIEGHKKKVSEDLLDKENRLRELEKGMAKIMTWGSAGIFAISIIQFIASNFF